jgi:IS1 family transposase
MANVLPFGKQVAAIGALVEGCSIRSVERMTGVHRDTLCRLLVRVGEGCASLIDERMVNLPCECLELDELWSYVGKKQRQVREGDNASKGDAWVYVALDADTKLIPTYLVGKRTQANTHAFVDDLSSRLRNRVQLSTDGLRMYVHGLRMYVHAIRDSFGPAGVDYATVVKTYEADPIGEGRYSPPRVASVEKTPIMGEPLAERVTTSHVERQNLTMRMGMRRFTRLTNAFSKKLENHCAAVALHVAHYNFVRVHRSLRVTPAMAANVERSVWSMDELVGAALERAA